MFKTAIIGLPLQHMVIWITVWSKSKNRPGFSKILLYFVNNTNVCCILLMFMRYFVYETHNFKYLQWSYVIIFHWPPTPAGQGTCGFDRRWSYFWHVISQLRTALYWNHIVPDRQGSAASKIRNHCISPSLRVIRGWVIYDSVRFANFCFSILRIRIESV